MVDGICLPRVARTATERIPNNFLSAHSDTIRFACKIAFVAFGCTVHADRLVGAMYSTAGQEHVFDEGKQYMSVRDARGSTWYVREPNSSSLQVGDGSNNHGRFWNRSMSRTPKRGGFAYAGRTGPRRMEPDRCGMRPHQAHQMIRARTVEYQ